MKILIVEDEHKIANSIKKGLEQENMTADVSYNGEEGYDLASDGDYDCIVLDLMLPGMDGIAVCKKLRENNIHTPILILTARGELDDKVTGLNTGADDYLVKPFAFSELLARVKALLRRPRQALSQSITIQDLQLNTSTFEVTRETTPIILSRKEFSLLEFLMRHPGRVFTKDQIIQTVWPYDSDILPNTVEVYIGYLRNKIDKPFKNKNPLIHTVRGFGYKIE
jgi:DNA-binding response OmpR family regulator